MSPGAALADARRRAGLTVAQVSQQTRIREGIIRGIEDDDYTGCGGDFYARGHIRAMARAVGTDPVPLIEEYDAAQGVAIGGDAITGEQPALRPAGEPNVSYQLPGESGAVRRAPSGPDASYELHPGQNYQVHRDDRRSREAGPAPRVPYGLDAILGNPAEVHTGEFGAVGPQSARDTLSWDDLGTDREADAYGFIATPEDPDEPGPDGADAYGFIPTPQEPDQAGPDGADAYGYTPAQPGPGELGPGGADAYGFIPTRHEAGQPGPDGAGTYAHPAAEGPPHGLDALLGPGEAEAAEESTDQHAFPWLPGGAEAAAQAAGEPGPPRAPQPGVHRAPSEPDPVHRIPSRFDAAGGGFGGITETAPRPPAPRPPRRRRNPAAVIVLALLVVIGVVAYLLSAGSGPAPSAAGHSPSAHPSASGSASHPAPSPSPTTSSPAAPPPPQTLRPAQVIAFGPGGPAHGDNQQEAAAAVDGRLGTAWKSDWYSTSHFGNLQAGTGLLLDMGHPVTITGAQVLLGGSGASLQLRAGAAATLAALHPVAGSPDAGGVVRLQVAHPVQARYLLIWFTGLPVDAAGTYQALVYNIRVQGNG